MAKQDSSRRRVYFTLLVMLAEFGHLAWEHFHGGIASHHVLNRPDLPAISNAWGAILLPVLAWFLVGRINRRVARQPGRQGSATGLPSGVVAGFFGALVFGIGLSAAFTFDFTAISSNMFIGALLLATVLPLYRAECVLGFILGMTFTFGAVLPSIIGSIIAAIAAFFSFCIHPLLFWLAGLFTRARQAGRGRGHNPGD